MDEKRNKPLGLVPWGEQEKKTENKKTGELKNQKTRAHNTDEQGKKQMESLPYIYSSDAEL
jgi:hypothetical protein